MGKIIKGDRGFTLPELLATVVILSIITAIAIPVYFNISRNAKENEYESKRSYLESLAQRYAEENNISIPTKISVSRLVAAGYTSAEMYEETVEDREIPFISNPKDDNDNLACHILDITKENYEYNANLSDNSDCSFAVEDIIDSRIGIKAYEITNNVVGNQIDFLDSTTLKWTNKDVLIVVNPSYDYIKSITIATPSSSREVDLNKTLQHVTPGKTIDPNQYSNIEIITAAIITKTTVNVALEINDTIKTSKVDVQIDKEPSTVDVQKFSGWTSTAKGATIYISDGAGSGAKGVYISEDNNYDNRDLELKTVDKNDDSTVSITNVNGKDLTNKRYYLWAEDNAGNISPKSLYIDIENIDDIKPHTSSVTIESTNSKYNSNKVNVTIVSDDGTGSGVTYACIKTSEGSDDCDWQPYGSGTFSNYLLPSSEGSGDSYTLYAYVRDAVGNVSEEKVKSNVYELYTKCNDYYYGEWSSCAGTCGTGTKSRSAYDSFLGGTCNAPNLVSSCSLPDCCSSTKTEWGSCSVSCGTGTKVGTIVSNYNGQTCGTTSSSCSMPDCCSSVTYGAWGSCSASCGGGTQSRSYTSAYNGQYCGSQTQSCNTHACPTWHEIGHCKVNNGGWDGSVSSVKSDAISYCASYFNISTSYFSWSCDDVSWKTSWDSDDTIGQSCDMDKYFWIGSNYYNLYGDVGVMYDTNEAGNINKIVKDRHAYVELDMYLEQYY